MNPRTLAPALLAAALALGGCAPREAALTEAQKAQITQEVSARMKAFVAAIERADADSVLAFLTETPSFQWADLDGKVYGPEETRKNWKEGIAGAQSMSYPTTLDRITVLAPDAAFQMSHSATSGILLKDGTKLTRGTFTFACLWRKEGGVWKIAACQESSLPPVPEKVSAPAKK